MNDRTKSLADIFSFNSKMVRFGLEDLTDEGYDHRMRGGEGSSIRFLVGHLLASRIAVLKLLGQEAEADRMAAGSPAGSEEPSLAEQRERWDEVAETLSAALGRLGDEDALAPQEGLPVADRTVRGALMFRSWHESYHVGQIGMIRTELGYPALRTKLQAELSRAG